MDTGRGIGEPAPAPPISTRRRSVELALVAYCVVASSLGAALFARGIPGLADVSFWRLLFWQSPAYLTWALLLPLIGWIGGRLRNRSARAALAGYSAAGLLLIPIHALFTAWWFERGHPLGAAAFIRSSLARGAVERVPIELLMYCAIVGTVYARDYALRFGEERTRAERLERELLASRLEALEARLRPHFLFNTLQSITVLIRREPEAAVRMTKDLAALLRHSLETVDRPLVSLGSELELLERYVAIERVRFADRLCVTVDVEPAARRCLVPDLLLQPLVENAIHHGIGPRPGPGAVVVRAAIDGGQLRIDVSDDGVGLAEGTVDGVGLGVTRSRLAGLYGKEHVFSVGRGAERGTLVHMELPARPEGAPENA